MGTRSLTRWYEEAGKDGVAKEIVCMYRQFDGYPKWHGQALFEFLQPIVMVNGIGVGDTRVMANGAGCLAMQGIAYFKIEDSIGKVQLAKILSKTGVGGKRDTKVPVLSSGSFYLYPAGSTDCGQEYEYEVRPGAGPGDPIRVVVLRPAWVEHDWSKPTGKNGKHKVKKRHPVKVLFDGTVEEMGKWLADGAQSDNDEN